MDLIKHLSDIATIEQTREKFTGSVFVFCTQQAIPSFFNVYKTFCKEKGISLISIHKESYEVIHQLFAELSMSFLGQSCYYWLGDFGSYEASEKKELIAFLQSYKGPHTLFLSADQIIEGLLIIELPQYVDKDFIRGFYALLNNKTELHSALSFRSKCTFESACQFLRYYVVLDDADDNIQQLYDRINTAEYSLFELAQYFFMKDKQRFKTLWSTLSVHFAVEFWVVYWSEQLWQASLFIKQAAELGPLSGRKGITRLPFSFMQRDWKQYSARELCAANNFLYAIDYGSKNGYATHGLDLFIEHWMRNSFAKK